MTRYWWSGLILTLMLLPAPSGPAVAAAPLSNVDGALSQLTKDLADQSLPLGQRVETARVLAGWGGDKVRVPLLGALKDPAPELRALAARGLGWPGNREAVPALRERAEASDEVPAVRGAALEALGLIGDKSNRPLVVAATKDANAAVREPALWAVALGPMTDPADRTGYLIQLAEDGALAGLLRCDAIRALSSVNEPRVSEAFKRILQGEPRFAVAPPEGPGTQQQIMELRRVQARDVSAWVAEGLGLLKDKSAIPLLLASAEDRSDFFLRIMSMRALIVLEAREAAPVYTRRLDDPVADIRILALAALAHLGDRAAAPAVFRRLTDPSPQVRAQAVTSLAVLGDPSSVRPVLEDLQKRETESNVQGAIEEALVHLSR